MRRPGAIRALAITVVAVVGACHPKAAPSTRPTIEDLGVPGDVCFPTRQPDNRGQPNGSDVAPTSSPATQGSERHS